MTGAQRSASANLGKTASVAELQSQRRRSKLVERFGLRLLLVASGLLLAAVPLLILVVLVRSDWDPLHRLDFSTANSLNAYIAGRSRQIDLWKVVSAVLGPTVLRSAAALATVALWFRGHRRLALLVLVTMVGAAILSGGTKLLVGRVRPVVNSPVDHAAGASFPSGHSLTSIVAVGLALVMVVPVVSRGMRPVLIATGAVLVAAVGFSRLILGDHFVSDVIGGWIIGIAWLLMVVGAFHVAARSSGLPEQTGLDANPPDDSRRGI